MVNDYIGAPSSWMETYSGIHFDLANPRPEQITLLDIAHSLSHQCRYNGQCKIFYSVAEHSIRVAAILPDDLKMAGLLHDGAEPYTGDMIRPMKRLLPDIYWVESRILKVIFEKFNILPELVHSEQIKEADNVLIRTELRDLMSGDTKDWGMEDIEPLPETILPMSFLDAKYSFIRAFKKYQGDLDAAYL